jgi:hypothetical protein
MRTSLNEIKTIDAYLTGAMKPGERVLFEATMLLNCDLRKNVKLQKKVMSLVHHHHLSNLKETFNACHHALWNDPANAELKQAVIQLFKTK